MKNGIWFALFAALTVTSCNPKSDWRKRQVDNLEYEVLQSSEDKRLDSVTLYRLLDAYEAYAEEYPSDTMGAKYLMKAADFYRYMHKPLRSIKTYGLVYDNYPQYSKRPYALFFQGFTYENELANYTAARNYYEKFLKEYPDNPLAKDIKTTLENLGKSPEQMLMEIMAKQHHGDSTLVVQ